MHNFKGAFSETMYIYGQALDLALERGLPPKYFVLGLGLGYIEMMIAAALYSHKITEAEIWSTENEDILVEQFLMWLEDDLVPQPDFQNAYNWILAKMAQTEGVDPLKVKKLMMEWRRGGQWRWFGPLNDSFSFSGQRFSVIFFDAFSDKINPELWTEELVDQTLKNAAAPQCIFTTYAAKGRLKRVLKNNGFELIETPGYGSKKESTIAVRL